MSLTTTPEPAMLGFLQRAVADPDFDVQKFEVVLSAVREEQAKHAEREFYRAMAEAQGEMEPIRKDATNQHTKSKYARFEAIDGQLRPIYTKHGFSVSYRTGTPTQPGAVRMICTVAHSAGHHIEAELEAALDGSGAQGRSNKTDVQATGSTVSYLRRYILNMVFNVALASEDDDGEGSRRQPQQGRHSRPSPSQSDSVRWQDEPPEDRARDGALELERRVRAATTEEELHAIAGDPDIAKKREWLAKHRPELDQIIAEAFGKKYEELTRSEAEVPA